MSKIRANVISAEEIAAMLTDDSLKVVSSKNPYDDNGVCHLPQQSSSEASPSSRPILAPGSQAPPITSNLQDFDRNANFIKCLLESVIDETVNNSTKLPDLNENTDDNECILKKLRETYLPMKSTSSIVNNIQILLKQQTLSLYEKL